MEASVATARRLDGDRATRIVMAMRASVGTRGAAASTFDVVANEAGVSRGLLHYYFGSKERLLVEVVRRDCEERVGWLARELAKAHDVDEVVATLVATLNAFVEGEPASQAVLYEILSVSRHSDDVRDELAELYRRWRQTLASSLADKQDAGVVTLDAAPDAVAAVLLALGDGLGLQLISDSRWPERDAALRAGEMTVRRLLGDPSLA